MANNKLILRTVISPWVTPFNDITTNSVLSRADVDNNFIYLKGEIIHSGYTNNNQLILQKINGQNIIINGVGGGSSADVFVTGGTYSNGVATFTNNTGGTFNISGFFTGGTDVFVTGGTYSNGVATFTNNTGGTFAVTGFTTGSADVFVTGGTYDNTTGTATFTDSSGNTFNVSGFLTGYTNYYTTGATLNDSILSFDRTDTLSAYTVDLSSLTTYGNKWFIPSGTTIEIKENHQSFIYGDLYVEGTVLLNDNSQLVVLNGDIILSGGSISGNGTTLLVDLPMVDTYMTGGTYSGGSLTLTNNFGDDIAINGFYTGSTGDYLPLSGGTMYDNAIIQFDNASQLREGTYDFGGYGGISQICAVSYENNWQAGTNHIFDYDGFIRESRYCFNTIPDNNFDSNSRFKVGSRWVLDNGDVYICSDDTVGSAVWYLEDNDTYITGGTYVTGGTIIFDYSTGGGFQLTGLTEDLNNEIAGLAEADEQTITLNLDTNKIELKETVASATGGTRTFQGNFAISGGTLNLNTIGSGSPVINLGLDSSGFVVTGITGGQNVTLTGGTYDNSTGTAIFTNNTGGTFTVNGFFTGSTDTYVTGGTYNNSTGIVMFTNNTGGTFTVNGFFTGSTEQTYWSASTGTNAIVVKFSNSLASGDNSLAEGYYTTSSGDYSHSEGFKSIAIGIGSHAEGGYSGTTRIGGTAIGNASHAEGIMTTSSGIGSHAEGFYSTASGDYSHAEGSGKAIGASSHAEGNGTTASGNQGSHAEGDNSKAIGIASHAEGQLTTASGFTSHAEGSFTAAIGDGSHAEGNRTRALGMGSHAEGYLTTAIGIGSHAEGYYSTAIGIASHAEGFYSTASGDYSHAEGGNSTLGITNGKGGYALGIGSHAEGLKTTASGNYSHAEGYYSTASGEASHSGGDGSIASGTSSFIHSTTSIVLGDRSVVLGGQNITGSTDDTVYVPDFVITKSASVPTTSGDTVGEIGSITWDDTNLYVKTSNGWGKIPLDYSW